MLKLPVYFERFVRWQFPQKPHRWEQLTEELIHAASEGEGCKYSLNAARNLCESRNAGYAPEQLGCLGLPSGEDFVDTTPEEQAFIESTNQ